MEYDPSVQNFYKSERDEKEPDPYYEEALELGVYIDPEEVRKSLLKQRKSRERHYLIKLEDFFREFEWLKPEGNLLARVWQPKLNELQNALLHKGWKDYRDFIFFERSEELEEGLINIFDTRFSYYPDPAYA